MSFEVTMSTKNVLYNRLDTWHRDLKAGQNEVFEDTYGNIYVFSGGPLCNGVICINTKDCSIYIRSIDAVADLKVKRSNATVQLNIKN